MCTSTCAVQTACCTLFAVVAVVLACTISPVLGCQFPCAPCREQKQCPEGVPHVLDGCQCCHICAGQRGQPCDSQNICDRSRNLTCIGGVCVGANSGLCVVAGRVHRDEEQFRRGCGSLCTCQGGSYVCTSLCPQELVRPAEPCHDPVLAHVPGECCRQWRCSEMSPESRCESAVTEWSYCSSSCGLGTSRRWTISPACQRTAERRLCQWRECEQPSWTGEMIKLLQVDKQVCQHTHSSVKRLYLEWEGCRSIRRFRLNYCGLCQDLCCQPSVTTTRRVKFLCPHDRWRDGRLPANLWSQVHRPADALAERNISVTVPVMWIHRCQCGVC